MNHAIPHGITFGCRPRAEGKFSRAFRDGDLPTYIDRDLEPLPRSKWRKETGIPDSFIWHIFSQLDGMCTSNGATGGLMTCRELAAQPRILLAPEDLYDHVGRWNTGSSLGDNIDVLMRIGVRTRQSVPREWPVKRPADWEKEAAQFRLLEAIDLNGRFDLVVTALHKPYPVLIGVNWPGGGGHAILATYWNGNLRGPNSWDEDWGDHGFYELTERQCASMPGYGAYALRVASEADADPNPPDLGDG